MPAMKRLWLFLWTGAIAGALWLASTLSFAAPPAGAPATTAPESAAPEPEKAPEKAKPPQERAAKGRSAPASQSPAPDGRGKAGVAATPTDKAPTQPPPAVLAKLVVGDPLGPDDFALRYYASQKQKARIDAELMRLKRLYPNYEPPADLYEKPGSSAGDEEVLWQLYSADRVDDLKAVIAQRQKEMPDWKPSADLVKKLRRKELRLKVGSMFKAEKFLDLVDYLKAENVDLDDVADEVDVVWSIAEGYARAKLNNDAVNTFKRVLTSAKDPQIRIATVQKAMASVRMADVEKLLAAVPGAATPGGDLAPLAIDLTRARIAAFLHEERPEEVPAAEVEKFESYARESRDANQSGLVAWYNYKRQDYAKALEWFKLAIQNDGDAMIAHGLAHSLRALGQFRDAEEVAYAWHEPLTNNIILFLDLLETDLTLEIPPYIEADRLARYAKVTMEVASGEGAQALAWYAYNSCQFDVALFWFERALAWFPKDATAYGYALTTRRLKKEAGLFEMANRYDGLFAKVIEILFPDGYYHPPTPCDQKGAEKLHGPATRAAGYIAPGPALIPGAPANYDPQASNIIAQRRNSSRIELQTPIDVQLQQALKAIKGRFPAPVAPGNPFRFNPIPMPIAAQARAVASRLPAAQETPLAADPARTPAPLVARRVPGVGSMPYERYGFSLLPGWNGIETATFPPYSEQVALPGTLWAEQRNDTTRAGVALFDARNPANARGLPPGPYPAAGPPPLRPAPMQQPAPLQPMSAYPSPGQSAVYGQYPQPVRR